MDRNSWREIGDSILKKEGTTLIQSFLDEGLDVNALDDDGITMLTCAVDYNNMEVIEFLVQSGADVNIANLDGSKPIHRAAFNGHEDIVKVLLNTGMINMNTDDLSILGHAIRGGHLNLVKYLVSNKYAFDSKGSDGMTSLLFGAEYKHFDIVKYLVESGAGLDSRDEDGWGVLHWACLEEGSPDVVDYLLKKGCDPNDQDNSQETPLHYSARHADLEIIEHLLNAGADCNVENEYGETPFSIFIQSPLCLEGIALFLKNGAYFQPKDYWFIDLRPLLKEGVLKDVKLCTQSLINKFNFVDLPKVYEIPEVAQKLPAIEKMEISSHRYMQQNIADSVNYVIQTKGHCNILNVHPIFLYSLCVGSLIQHNGNCASIG